MRALSSWRRLYQAAFALLLSCTLSLTYGAPRPDQSTAKPDASPAPSACADPAADIEVALISKTGPATGRVRVTGIVRNLGSIAWTPTTPSHRLQMVLAAKFSEARPDGEPMQPPVAISQLSPGQQYRVDHQMDWDANKNTSYPKFIVRFSDSGKIGAYPVSYSPDCRTDNDRKEIVAADINRLFTPVPAASQPLELQSYRLLGGVGVNTVEATLAYKRTSTAAGKLTASVAAPYSGTADQVPITGNSGSVKMRVHVPCEHKDASSLPSRPVAITYRLWSRVSLPGGSSWVVSFSTEQFIPYGDLCIAGAAARP